MASLSTVAPRTTRGSAGFAIFALTSIGAFLVSLDVSIANVTLPAMGRNFPGSTRSDVSWVITAYAISFAAALIPGGRVADRAGRRKVFRTGLCLFAAGSGLCGIAPSLPLAVAGRILQGVGAAAAAPASLGLLLAMTGSHARSHMTARWGGTGALGIALGPVIGGAITTAASWRWAFLVNVPIVIVVVLAAPRVLTETPRHPGRRLPDPIGAVLLAIAATFVVLGLSEAPRWGWLSTGVIAALAGGLLVTSVFLRRCAAVPDPLIDLGLLRNRSFALVSVVTVFYSASFFGLLFSFVLFLTLVWHTSLVQAGLGILPMAVIVVALSTRVGAMAGRVGFGPLLLAGAGLVGVGLGVDAAWLTVDENFLTQWLPVVVVIGTGIGLCFPLLGAAAVSDMPAAEIAAASAVNQCARQLGAALGVAAAVAALGSGNPPSVGHFHLAWLVGSGFAAAAAAAACGLPRRGPERERPGHRGQNVPSQASSKPF